MQAVLNSPFAVSVQQFFGKLKFWSKSPTVVTTVEEVQSETKLQQLEDQVVSLHEEVKQVKAKKPYWKIITVALVVAVVIAAIVGYFMGYGVDLLIDQVKGVFSRV